jgi:hypothetical protein
MHRCRGPGVSSGGPGKVSAYAHKGRRQNRRSINDHASRCSRRHRDTYLYAMRYEVSVFIDRDTIAVHGTTCQVVVVYKDGGYDEPTVACEPIILDRITDS